MHISIQLLLHLLAGEKYKCFAMCEILGLKETEKKVSSNGDLHYEKFPTLCSTSQLTFHGWLADALAEVEASPAMASRRGASAS